MGRETKTDTSSEDPGSGRSGQVKKSSFKVFYNKTTASEIAYHLQQENLKESMGEDRYNLMMFYRNKSSKEQD